MYKPDTVRKHVSAIAKRCFEANRVFDGIYKSDSEFQCSCCNRDIPPSEWIRTLTTLVDNASRYCHKEDQLCYECHDRVVVKAIFYYEDKPLKDMRKSMKELKRRLEMMRRMSE
jgi:hypothetical protein